METGVKSAKLRDKAQQMDDKPSFEVLWNGNWQTFENSAISAMNTDRKNYTETFKTLKAELENPDLSKVKISSILFYIQYTDL